MLNVFNWNLGLVRIFQLFSFWLNIFLITHRGSNFVPVRHKGPESFSKHGTSSPKCKHTPAVRTPGQGPPVCSWAQQTLSDWNSLYGLQDGLPVLGRLQSDLLSDYICVFPLHARSGFRLRLYAHELVLVSQLHLVLDCRYRNGGIATWSIWARQVLKDRRSEDPTFPHGFLFLHGFLLFAKVFLIQDLL